MSDKVAEIAQFTKQDDGAAWVTELWSRYHIQRQGWLEEKRELRDYLFATDTTSTSNSKLPWKNSTTTPKLCQIRDNLHANYISRLFPNNKWLTWQSFDAAGAKKEMAEVIEAYMANKTREGGFRTEMSKLLYDYIDGNAFGTVRFRNSTKELPNGEVIKDYVGPEAVRISPMDIVFNPLAESFEKSFKIVRSVKGMGELRKLAQEGGEEEFWSTALERRELARQKLAAYTVEDFEKSVGYTVDGFGSYYEYLMGDFVEILEFFGDYHDVTTGELRTNQIITVVDRSTVVRQVDFPSWFGHAPIYHVGWRLRPDNLYAMGPLDNLVGLQYRLDHLENLAADAMDLAVQPPLAVTGEVEEFEWGPGAEISIDEGGSVEEIARNLSGIIQAENKMAIIEDRMELYAGAPREAMGVRTPGEKTLGEVNQLSTAANRIFQEKITHFEIELLEKILNAMLETARRNMDSQDIVSVVNSELGAQDFVSITREDITANGVVRPVGARHFAQEAQDLQNLLAVFNSPVGQQMLPHTSGIELTKFVADVTNLRGYNIFQPNVAIQEQQDSQRLVNQASEDLAVEAQTAVDQGL